MSADPVFDHHLRNAILALRQRIRFEDGGPYDARCSTVAVALEAQFCWKRAWGRLHLLDARVCWQHCWNHLADGRILDATADQFEARWLGDIVVLEASDPHARAYQPAPPGWTFTLREQEAEIELVAVRDGRDAHEATISCTNWMVAARQALTMMTGWSVPDDLVDYAARALRGSCPAQPVDDLWGSRWSANDVRRGACPSLTRRTLDLAGVRDSPGGMLSYARSDRSADASTDQRKRFA